MARRFIPQPGLSLVEILLTISLMGMIAMTFASFMLKSSVTTSSLSGRFREASEIQALILDIQQDFRQGVLISDNSHGSRLEYTTYDSSGSPSRKIYWIDNSTGTRYLRLSKDGGSTWISPYRISDYTKYQLGSTAKFIYASNANNCTDFVDTNSNGAWVVGEGANAGSCPSSTTLALNKPSQANKIDLKYFSFTTGTGSPVAARTLPDDIFISSPYPGLVVSSTASASPAAKDSPLVQKFITNSANTYGTTFDIRSAFWDTARHRLIIVGGNGSAHKIVIADRRGVSIGTNTLTTALNTLTGLAVAMKNDGETALLLDSSEKVYSYDLTSSTIPLVASASLDVNALINSPTGIAFDSYTPTDFYIVGADTTNANLYKVYERNISTGALVGTAWSLPAAFDSTHPSGGLAIEPVTGDFLVVRNYINGTTPNKTIDIYRIKRSDGTSTSFSVNIEDLGSTTTGTTAGNWGLSYDPATNRLFLTDITAANDYVYEVIPSTLISPRS